MPVVPAPTGDDMPRIAIFEAPLIDGVKVMPGVILARSLTSRTLRLSRDSWLKAEIASGTSRRDCSRRVAVTTISWSTGTSVVLSDDTAPDDC